MSAVERVLKIASGEVGTVEKPVNRTPYGAWYGMDGQPWCAIWVSWIFAKAGCPDAIGGKQHRVKSVLEWAKKNGRVVQEPRRGDLVIFQWRTGWHIGLIEDAAGSLPLQTIEGNTSPGNGGSQRDGGGVYRRSRDMSGVVAFVRPIYPEEAQVLSDEDVERVASRVVQMMARHMEPLPRVVAEAVWSTQFWRFGVTDEHGQRVPIPASEALFAAERAASYVAGQVAAEHPPPEQTQQIPRIR